MRIKREGQIPFQEIYRGIGLHNHQSEERLVVVRREIDETMVLTDLSKLFEIARDISKAPETRLLAGAMLRARHEVATDDRRTRPDINLEVVDAVVGCLSGEHWRSQTHFCSILDTPAPPGKPGPAKREVELPPD